MVEDTPEPSEVSDEEIELEASAAPNTLSAKSIRESLRASRAAWRNNAARAEALRSAAQNRPLLKGGNPQEAAHQEALDRAAASEEQYVTLFAAETQAYAAAGLAHELREHGKALVQQAQASDRSTRAMLGLTAVLAAAAIAQAVVAWRARPKPVDLTAPPAIHEPAGRSPEPIAPPLNPQRPPQEPAAPIKAPKPTS